MRRYVRLVALALAPSWALPASAQQAADFYKGRTVTMVVSTSSGGG